MRPDGKSRSTAPGPYAAPRKEAAVAPGLIILLDLAIIACAALSGLFWYLASRRRVRRISRSEVLDSRDINRLIVAFNRAQLLNCRAALATSATGLLAAIRLGLDIV
jgi:hypothetical protein